MSLIKNKILKKKKEGSLKEEAYTRTYDESYLPELLQIITDNKGHDNEAI